MDAKPAQHIEITHPNNVNLKLAFHKVVSFHPHHLTFTPQTYHHPVHRFRSWPMQTTSHPHTSTSAAKKYIQPYLHKVFAWTKQNNLLLNSDKTTCTLFTPDPAEYTSNLDNKALPMATHPKVLGLTLDPKLIYSTHIHNISVQAHKPLQIIKALTATGWGKQKKTLMATYKAVMRPALEYASSVWSPIASLTSINKLQVMPNAALRTATGCTQDTNIQHLHDETLTHPPHTRAPTAPHITIQTENTTSITSPTQTHNILQHSKVKKAHYCYQRPLHNKRYHRPPHSHYNRHKHAPYTYYLLSLGI